MSEYDIYIGNRMTIVEKPDPLHHPHKVIVHGLKNPLWVFAAFDSMKQLEKFAIQLGITYELESEQVTRDCGLMRTYRLSKRLLDAEWNGVDVDVLPENAEKIKALSRGRIVECFIDKGTWTIYFYRPSPSACDIYHPLSSAQHMKYQETFGMF